jgi:hypothetical protein
MVTKIRWTFREREALLKEVREQFFKHPNMPTIELIRMSQKLALPTNRRREITSVQQVAWIEEELDFLAKNQREPEPIPLKEEPVKPDLKSLLVELLSDAMVQMVAEAIVRARQKLDLPLEVVKPQSDKPKLKKIAVYGLLPAQQNEVREALSGCYEFRFLKDAPQEKLVSAAKWADKFIIMTKFVSHDYGAIRKFGNIVYESGATSNLITSLEHMYVADHEV